MNSGNDSCLGHGESFIVVTSMTTIAPCVSPATAATLDVDGVSFAVGGGGDGEDEDEDGDSVLELEVRQALDAIRASLEDGSASPLFLLKSDVAWSGANLGRHGAHEAAKNRPFFPCVGGL
jgi:hypothetical protein